MGKDFIILEFIVTPLAFLCFCFFLLDYWPLFLFFHFFQYLGAAVCNHRYFAHRSFEPANQYVEKFLLIWGYWSLQGTPLGWAALHRDHHKYCDTRKDIHSPIHGTNRFSQFFYSHMGWMARHSYNGNLDSLSEYGAEHPTRILHDKLSLKIFIVAHLVVSFLICGWIGIVLDLAARFTSLHAMLAINSVCHMFGVRKKDRICKAGNVGWAFCFQLGDNWHMNHHDKPKRASNQVAFYQLDLIYLFIRLMASFRLVKNLN